jgi:hypothetical protein
MFIKGTFLLWSHYGRNITLKSNLQKVKENGGFQLVVLFVFGLKLFSSELFIIFYGFELGINFCVFKTLTD